MNRSLNLKTNQKGFTLLEILIVLIIVGVLAGLAIPVYQAQVLRSFRQEALNTLGSTRESLARFFAENGTFATANIAAVGCNIDFCPNTDVMGVRAFDYSFSAQAANTFTLQAAGNGAKQPVAANTVTITEAGVLGGTLV